MNPNCDSKKHCISENGEVRFIPDGSEKLCGICWSHIHHKFEKPIRQGQKKVEYILWEELKVA